MFREACCDACLIILFQLSFLPMHFRRAPNIFANLFTEKKRILLNSIRSIFFSYVQAADVLYVEVDPSGSDTWKLEPVIELIKNGAVGVIPTDTVYALTPLALHILSSTAAGCVHGTVLPLCVGLAGTWEIELLD